MCIRDRLSRQRLASVLNDCLELYSSETLLLIRDEKISAAHSGDSMDYSVLPIDELLKVLTKTLDDRFPGSMFQGGYRDHSLSSASWTMPGQKEDLLGAYAKPVSYTHLDVYKRQGLYMLNSELKARVYTAPSLVL